jgi:hypothetical protein
VKWFVEVKLAFGVGFGFGDFVFIRVGGSLWLSRVFISVYVVWCLNFLLNAPP